MTLTCKDCGTGISAQSVQGRCRRCAIRHLNKDPGYRQRRAEANRRKARDPAYRAKLIGNLHAAHAAWRSTPEGAEKLRALGKEALALMNAPEKRALWRANRAAAGRKRHETVMAWCPPEYREEYRRLVRSKKIRAADAKGRILIIVEQDKCARLARSNIADIRHFLSRFTPVLPKGKGWLYGTVVVSAEELARRALNKGWRPERWAA